MAVALVEDIVLIRCSNSNSSGSCCCGMCVKQTHTRARTASGDRGGGRGGWTCVQLMMMCSSRGPHTLKHTNIEAIRKTAISEEGEWEGWRGGQGEEVAGRGRPYGSEQSWERQALMHLGVMCSRREPAVRVAAGQEGARGATRPLQLMRRRNANQRRANTRHRKNSN